MALFDFEHPVLVTPLLHISGRKAIKFLSLCNLLNIHNCLTYNSEANKRVIAVNWLVLPTLIFPNLKTGSISKWKLFPLKNKLKIAMLCHNKVKTVKTISKNS